MHYASYKAFYEAFISSLFKNSACLPQPSKPNDPISQIQWRPLVEHGYKPEKISEKEVAYIACLYIGRLRLKDIGAGSPYINYYGRFKYDVTTTRRGVGNS